jgi:hypothetical protein
MKLSGRAQNYRCGRVQRAVLRALRAARGQPVSTRSIMLEWSHRRRLGNRASASRAIRRAADQVAVRVKRTWPGGNVWRLP